MPANGKQKGAATMLAMAFVAVFGVLSIAFYTLTASAISTASNDKAAAIAQGAAESGFEYVRFLLSRPVNQFSSTAEPTTSSELQAIYDALNATYSVNCNYASEVLRIPATGTISLFPQSAQKENFYATVAPDPDQPHMLNVTVVGGNGGASGKVFTRSVSARCAPFDTSTPVSSPLDFGVASQGTISFKNNVHVVTEDTGAEDVTDATMLSASSASPSVVVTSNADVDTIMGTIWVTESVNQVDSNVTSENTTVKVLTNPPYFDDYALPESTYTSDPTFAVYNNWAEFMADTSRTKTRVYIKGPSEITIDGRVPINASLVFSPDVTTIDIEGANNPNGDLTRITADPDFKYAIIAPAAHITYNGNTGAEITGYIVADKFGINPNNSSTFTIRSGGLITLSSDEDACNLGQSDLYIYLPEKEDRPTSTHNLTYRRYVMSYEGYQEN